MVVAESRHVVAGKDVSYVQTIDALGNVIDADSPVIVAGEAHLGEVGGNTQGQVATVTRPANTTAYVSGDEMSNHATPGSVVPLSWSAAGRIAAQSGYITKARLSINNKLATFTARLWLFNVAPTAVGDNNAYNLLDSEFSGRIGFIDFDALATESGASSDCAISQSIALRLAYGCAAASTTLYGLLVVKAGYTPAANSEIARVQLTFERN